MKLLTNGKFGGGDGTELNPYLVEDAQDLNSVRNKLSAHYKQTKDIDLKSIPNFEPIGDHDNPFTGLYNGDGRKIINLTIESDVIRYCAFIGVCVGAKVINTHIQKADIKCNIEYGMSSILVAYPTDGSLIENCSVNGKVECVHGTAGGISGSFYKSDAKKCAVINSVIKGYITGGFCAFSNGVIENSYATGKIIVSLVNQFAQTASFVQSLSNAKVKNAYSVIETEIENESDIKLIDSGYFVHSNWNSTLENCYLDYEKGGPVKWMDRFTYYTGASVQGTDGRIYECYRSQSHFDDYFDPSWNQTGPPPGFPFPYHRAQPTIGEVWNQFWVLSTASEVKNTKEMKTKSTFIDWDFENVWKIREGVTYPTLFALPVEITCKRVPLNNYRR